MSLLEWPDGAQYAATLGDVFVQVLYPDATHVVGNQGDLALGNANVRQT